MHRFRSRRTLFRLRTSSLMFVTLTVSLLLLVPTAVWGFLFQDPRGVQATIYLLIASIVSGLLYLILAAGVRCPLCHGPLLGNPGCVRSPKASRLFRSHRLGVAASTLLLGRFRCPCCGEACRCALHRR